MVFLFLYMLLSAKFNFFCCLEATVDCVCVDCVCVDCVCVDCVCVGPLKLLFHVTSEMPIALF